MHVTELECRVCGWRFGPDSAVRVPNESRPEDISQLACPDCGRTDLVVYGSDKKWRVTYALQ